MILTVIDYTQVAEKSYRKNLKGFKPDLEGYKKAKDEALAKGQIIQTRSGELVAVDEDRRFYTDANSLGLTDHKPSKESIDRLVEETKKRYILDNTFLMFLGKRNKKQRDGRNVLEMMVIYRISINGTKCLIRNSHGKTKFRTLLILDFMINIPGKQERRLKEGVVCKCIATLIPSIIQPIHSCTLEFSFPHLKFV